jgi:Ca2+-binding RTX toxin-like protein
MSPSTSSSWSRRRNRGARARNPRAWIAIVLVLSLAVAILSVSPAAANHIAGATYNGTVQGGTGMSFTVSANGSGITAFNVAGPLPGSSCTFGGSSAMYPTPLPITNHTFADTTDPLTFSGSFPGQQSASGTLRIRTSSPSCDTGPLSWTATTAAPLPPPPPGAGARCAGKPATKVGTAGRDNLRGTRGRDVIVGRGGADVIAGLAGNDLVCAGAGNDTVRGGRGRDRLLGGSGRDRLVGGPGADVLAGGPGRDIERQ